MSFGHLFAVAMTILPEANTAVGTVSNIRRGPTGYPSVGGTSLMITSKISAFEFKQRLARYGGVGDAYRAGKAFSYASSGLRGALAVWEGEGGRIAPSPAQPSRP